MMVLMGGRAVVGSASTVGGSGSFDEDVEADEEALELDRKQRVAQSGKE